ncbi:MAG: Hsp33 family molecular chaperone HslO [Henriciella sp.]|nr:Hsp33 family molecular chaperone HslO [Henriciella sp.]
MAPTNIALEDYVTGFSPQGLPVTGRMVRMAEGTLSPILKRHAYPDHLAEILGEALMLSVLVGSGMKFQGRVMAQAEGDGPVSMLVGEYRKDGGLRAYARHETERWAHLERVNKGDKPHMPQLFGAMGRLGLIIVHDNPDLQPYQGIVPLAKGSLAECARDYFRQSEQVETHLMMAINKTSGGAWSGGGMILQRIAGDEARGDTDEGWREAEAKFATLSADELLDPALPAEQLIYRLFHEGGVTMDAVPQPLVDACTCNRQRLVDTLSGMSDEALYDMVEPDGTLGVDCQFCSRHYSIPIEDVTSKTS